MVRSKNNLFSEIILFEFSVSNKKRVPLGNYKTASQNDLYFTNQLNLDLNFFSSMYVKNYYMCSFDLDSFIDSLTCCKSINPTCIDLILTNKNNHFMNSVFITNNNLI